MYSILTKKLVRSTFAAASLYGLWTTTNKQYYLNSKYYLFQHRVSYIAECLDNNDSNDKPYLGCSLRSMMDKPGMMVLLVNSESPAWHAGLKVGDILLEIDGQKINNINDYYAAMSSRSKKKNFLIIRNGEERTFEVNLWF